MPKTSTGLPSQFNLYVESACRTVAFTPFRSHRFIDKRQLTTTFFLSVSEDLAHPSGTMNTYIAK